MRRLQKYWKMILHVAIFMISCLGTIHHHYQDLVNITLKHQSIILYRILFCVFLVAAKLLFGCFHDVIFQTKSSLTVIKVKKKSLKVVLFDAKSLIFLCTKVMHIFRDRQIHRLLDLSSQKICNWGCTNNQKVQVSGARFPEIHRTMESVHHCCTAVSHSTVTVSLMRCLK